MEKKRLLLIMAAAFVIRLIFVLTLKNQFYFDDEFEYHRMIANFLGGNGLIVSRAWLAFRPPLFPLAASIFYAAGLDLIGIRLFKVIVSTATVGFIYGLARRLFSVRVAGWSGLAAAVYPFFIFYNGFLLTETLFVFLVVSSIWAAERSLDEPGIRPAVAVGVSLGLAGLCRPTMELFVPILFVVMFLSGSGRDGARPSANAGMTVRKMLVIGVAFVVTLSPWVIRNYRLFHAFIPGTTMGGRVFWEGNNPYSEGGPSSYFPYEDDSIREPERYAILYGKTREVIRDDPGRFVWLLGHKFMRFWNLVPNASGFAKPLYRWVSVLSFGILMPFFLLGFWWTLADRRVWMIHALIVFFTAFHMVFLASIRYRVPIEPFYIILAVYGITRFGDKIRETLTPL